MITAGAPLLSQNCCRGMGGALAKARRALAEALRATAEAQWTRAKGLTAAVMRTATASGSWTQTLTRTTCSRAFLRRGR